MLLLYIVYIRKKGTAEYLTLHVTMRYSLYYKINFLFLYEEMENETTKQKIQAIN